MSVAGTHRGPLATAVPARVGIATVLLALAALAWWSTAERMAGMDQGPGTDLGPLGWFVGVWVVMTAAMMFPSLTPTIGVYARMTRHRPIVGSAAFLAGYGVSWTVAGVVAYAVAALVHGLPGDPFAWQHAGRWVAGGALVVAAAYELTPLKDACLTKCRSPVGFLLGCWREGVAGALGMGARSGLWCVGCCWALMASLFALGVMSVMWMALIAAIIALEKALPWSRPATYGAALALLVLGVLLIADPGAVPGLVVPGDAAATGMGGHGAAMPMP